MTHKLQYVSAMGQTGYFTAARRLILALAASGVDVAWTPVARFSPRDGPIVFGGTGIGDPDLDPLLHPHPDCDTILLHTLPELMPHWLDRKGNRRIVGYTVWETDRLQAHWIPILNRLDHLLVPCTWNRDLFRDQGVRVPISVLPHLPGPARPASHLRWSALPAEDLVFYCIETWSVRKNLDQALTLFRQCFSQTDGVRLVLKSTPWPEDGGILDRWPKLHPLRPFRALLRPLKRLLPRRAHHAWIEHAQARLRHIETLTPGGAPVDLVTEELSREELEGLHRRGDCYFSLTHGEGWGLGPFDAAAAGNPVIVTGWGGVLDYLDPASEGLLDWDPAPAWNRPEAGLWAQPRLAQAAARLAAFRADPAAAKGKALAAQPGLHARFGAAALLPLLQEVLSHG